MRCSSGPSVTHAAGASRCERWWKRDCAGCSASRRHGSTSCPTRALAVPGLRTPSKRAPGRTCATRSTGGADLLAVDTNVLVYAHRREPSEHPVALRPLATLAEGHDPWAIPWPCVYEFFSVVTNPRIWRDAASDPDQAWRQIDAWTASPLVSLLTDT